VLPLVHEGAGEPGLVDLGGGDLLTGDGGDVAVEHHQVGPLTHRDVPGIVVEGLVSGAGGVGAECLGDRDPFVGEPATGRLEVLTSAITGVA
jgi:hypothetical protein